MTLHMNPAKLTVQHGQCSVRQSAAIYGDTSSRSEVRQPLCSCMLPGLQLATPHGTPLGVLRSQPAA